MTAICTLTLAVGQFSTAITDDSSYLPYLAVTACAALAVAFATRSQRRIQ